MSLPNSLTILRIVLSPVFYLLFITPDAVYQLTAIVVFILAAITDWYDGSLARSRNQITRLGKFLDPLADKFLTSAAFLALAHISIIEWWMVWVMLGRDFVITGLRSLAESQGSTMVTSRTAQVKTFLQMTVLYALLLLVTVFNIPWFQMTESMRESFLHPIIIYYVVLAVTVFTVITGVQYLYQNRKIIARFIRIPTRVTS